MVQEEYLKVEDVNFDFLSKDKRFENLTGSIFGELEILGPYKKEGKTLKWVAKCSCGNVIKTSRTKLKQRGKVCCVSCSEEKRKTPIQQKLKDLSKERPDLLVNTYQGNTWADQFHVTCKNCGIDYEKRYRDLIMGVKGCSCCSVKRLGHKDKQNIVDTYCKDNGFDFISWDKNTLNLNLYCPTHEVNLNTYFYNLKQGKVCCPLCVSENRKVYNKRTTKSFIEVAESVHGKGNYDYGAVDYVDSDTKVKITCNTCKTANEQTPAGHLSGRGCKNCSTTGYKPEEPCWIYIMRLVGLCEEHNKIGITKDLNRRLYNVGVGSWFDIDYIYFRKLDKGWKAKAIERNILKQLKTRYSISEKYHKEGRSEIFNNNELPLVEDLLEEYITEEFYDF
ncbi:hypothetical protein NVP1193O_118 [Vibrio phage 1.193.O._10N.286.52.C6]|nr:hypothetical protein NVP1193O_118 [Vibrio phage 1.193.O._10N.286.52.C6]